MPVSEEEIEVSRIERLAQIKDRTLSADDALGKTTALLKLIDDHLAGHPVITSEPELYRLTFRAFENLFELQQLLNGARPRSRP